MQPNLQLRPLTEPDGPALAGLSFSAPVNGGIGYAANYYVDAVRGARALYGDMDGVAATPPGSTRMVGVGITRYGDCLYEGDLLPFALIGNLVVHPDFRNQGLIEALVEWQIQKARERVGEGGLLMANYQRGNLAYDRVFRRVLKGRAGPLLYHVLRGLPDAPTAPGLNGLSVGPLGEDELEQFSARLNAFYEGFNFHQPASPATLSEQIARTPFTSPIRHAYAAVDARGNLLAGLLVNEEYRVRELEIRSLPASLALINRVLRIIPAGGAVREVLLNHVWFQPGQARAARHMIDTVRWIWANRATSFSTLIDPRGPLDALIPRRPWSVTTRTVLAVQGPRPMNGGRLIRPII